MKTCIRQIGRSIVGAFALFAAVSGCVGPTPKPDPGPEPTPVPPDTGLTAEIRTFATMICPELLAAPEIAESAEPVVVRVAPFKNTTRHFFNSNLVMNRLRLELNRYGGGRIRFQTDNTNVVVVSTEVLRQRQEEKVRAYLKDLAKRIAANPQFANKDGTPVKMAVAPVLGVNIVNMNGDSFAAMLRAEIAMASNGRIQFLMPGVMDGADYWLTGQFIPETMKKEGVINLANYIDIIDERVRSGKPLDTASIVSEVKSSSDYTSTTTTSLVYEKERILSRMVNDPTFRENPNINKHLDMMIVRPKDKLAVFEDMFLIDQKTPNVAGRAKYVLSGEISGLSKKDGGRTVDYLLFTAQLNDPETQEIVYEGGHEVKLVSQQPLVYR